MEAWLDAIIRVGTAPVVAMYLLYDYSKKLTAMQANLYQLVSDIGRNNENSKTLFEKIDKLEDLIRDTCKK